MAQSTSISIFDSRKEERLNSGIGDQVSARTYNAIMCGTLLWGFIVNAIMVAFLALFTMILKILKRGKPTIL